MTANQLAVPGDASDLPVATNAIVPDFRRDPTCQTMQGAPPPLRGDPLPLRAYTLLAHFAREGCNPQVCLRQTGRDKAGESLTQQNMENPSPRGEARSAFRLPT